MRSISSWGCISADPHHVIDLSRITAVRDFGVNGILPGITYGMGRSYGDVCLNSSGTLWATKKLDHFISFDNTTGRLVCESGVLLRDIQRISIPRGWILPVTPGTQMVTVGGAIANDVHGKNHHVVGSFGNHVLSFTLVRTNGDVIRCSRRENLDFFKATIGGLGLTGIINQAEIQLKPVVGPWLDTETIPYAQLKDFFSLADISEKEWEYTVSWIDCLSGEKGRGLFMRGNHSHSQSLVKKPGHEWVVPFTPPFSLINPLSLRVFNTAYYHLKKWKAGAALSHYEPFFYPLDSLGYWNRIYGRKGFFQYQCVVPKEVGEDAVRAMLKTITCSGEGSFLAVLKTLGHQPSLGMLSFPMPGVTLALDFRNLGKPTHQLFAKLDAIVREAKGRIYPAKDARMPRELFEAGYPRLSEFLQYRDPGISSNFSRRLMGV